MSLARCVVVVLWLSVAVSAQTSAAKPSTKSAKASGASLQATIENLEKDGWEAFKNKDRKAFTALCTPDYTAVVADGKPAHDLKATLDTADQFKIRSYSLSDFKVTPLGPDALATYIASVNAVMADKPQDLKLNVTVVWVKRGGRWKALRYHESEIK